MNSRIEYLDGLKGLAALLVAIAHIGLIGFYYAFVRFGAKYTASQAAQVIFDHPVAGILANTSTGFALFFIMIPIFPVLKYRKSLSAAMLGNLAIKRYFQLLFLCLPAALISVLLYWNGLYLVEDLAEKTGCIWLTFLYPTGCNTLGEFLESVFYSIWVGQVNRCPLSVMWCMSMILYGSLAVYASYALFGMSRCRYMPGIILLVLSLAYSPLSLFGMGCLVTEYAFVNPEEKRVRIPPSLLLLLGLVLIKIPAPINPITQNAHYPMALGSALVLLAVHDSRMMQRLLSCRFLTFLGTISFEIILVHILFLVNIGCLFYEWLLPYTSSPFLRTVAVWIVVLIPTIPSAWLLHRFVSIPANRLLKRDFLGSQGG